MRILRLWQTEAGVKAKLLANWTSFALIGVQLICGLRATQAQNVCLNPQNLGGFSLDKSSVCVGSPINIVNPAPTLTSAAYDYQYDGKSSISQIGPSLSPTKTFSYTAPGSYTIVQVGSGNGSGTGTIYCQVVTVLPTAQVKFTVKTCSGRRAIIVPDATTLGQYDKYELYWGDGTREQKTRADMANELSHTYSNGSNTSYTLTVQGIYNPPADCRSVITSVPITVLAAATQPIITTLKTISDNSIEIDYQAGSGIAVQLYQKVNGSYVATGQNGTNSGTFTVQTDAKQVQCFEVATQDVCTGLGLTSDEVCSMVVSATAVNKQNNVSWQAYAGTATLFRYYRIYRGSSLAGQVANRNTTTFPDANNIACGVQYCYSLEATVGQTTIYSNTACVTGINGELPGNFGSTVVSIENNHPLLITTIPTTGASTSYTLIVSRASGPSGTFQQIGTAVNTNRFVDQTADPSAGSYCYEVVYQSNCGLKSAPSTPVCTVYLSSKSSNGIDWTAESPFSPATVGSYTLEIVDSLNGTKQEIALGGQTHYDPDPNDPNLQSQRYQIQAISSDGTISNSNYFTFRREVKVYAPDAFTPDGDGVNEVFLVKGIYFDQFKMIIYDRWGEVIYSATDKNQGWDGKINGQNAIKGQYMYRVEVVDLTGVKTVRTGAVLLIR